MSYGKAVKLVLQQGIMHCQVRWLNVALGNMTASRTFPELASPPHIDDIIPAGRLKPELKGTVIRTTVQPDVSEV